MKKTLDLQSTDCLAEQIDAVLVITLNRPEARNAFSQDMLEGLFKALDYAEFDPSVRAVVLTGAGKGFCAGGDVKGMNQRNKEGAALQLDEAIHKQRESQRQTSGKIYLMPKPVIAMLPGAAAGAGFSLALSADFRAMADTAFMTTAFAKVGFSGDYGGTFFLTQLVGLSKAKELYCFSDRMDSEACLTLGLSNWVFSAESLFEETMKKAKCLAEGPPLAYRYMKENLNRAALGGALYDCMDLEASHHVHTGLSLDHKEAVKAFIQKTSPQFKGQ